MTEPKMTPKSRSSLERFDSFEKDGIIVVGIDPGSRSTALVIRDGETVIHATTITREGNETHVNYALDVVDAVVPIINGYREKYPDLIIGIEGISDPKGFKGGQRAAINPKDIIRTGVTLGALVAIFRDAIIVAPGNNGSKHESQYPAELKGRRPKDLEGSSVGAGTRRHEQSAYDIAGKAAEIQKGSQK